MKKNNFEKIARAIFACVMLVSLLCGYALADAIWAPEDDFYTSHSNDCEYVNRDYYANGEGGYMELFTKPGGSSLGFADNGSIFHVQFSYTLGDEVWGVVEYSESEGKLISRSEDDYSTGWIKMSDTELKYDYLSFNEEHKTEYKPYEGDYSELSDAKNMVIWTFPNSGETGGTIDSIDENFAIESVYTDLDGVQWGFVGYYYGMKNFWICISNPTDTGIAAKDVAVPELNTPEPGSTPEPTANDLTTVIIVCIVAVVLITAILIAVFNRKKNKEDEKK